MRWDHKRRTAWHRRLRNPDEYRRWYVPPHPLPPRARRKNALLTLPAAEGLPLLHRVARQVHLPGRSAAQRHLQPGGAHCVLPAGARLFHVRPLRPQLCAILPVAAQPGSSARPCRLAECHTLLTPALSFPFAGGYTLPRPASSAATTTAPTSSAWAGPSSRSTSRRRCSPRSSCRLSLYACARAAIEALCC